MQNYQIAIIGGGPAGCQCALWLTMLGYHPLLIEKQSVLGGLLNTDPFVNNWLIGVENQTGIQYAQAIHSHIHANTNIVVQLATQVKSISNQLNQGFVIQTDNNFSFQTQYLVLATGVAPVMGDFFANDNILIGPGSHICDYNFRDKRVAIFGGGDNAAENYQYVQSQNANQIHIYARSLKAGQHMLLPIPKDNIYLGHYDVDCETMIVNHNNTTHVYDTFLVFYGWQANIPNGVSTMIQHDSAHNFVKTNQHRETCLKKLYAIGEVTHVTHPCIATALADGVIAAKAIQNDIEAKTQFINSNQ